MPAGSFDLIPIPAADRRPGGADRRLPVRFGRPRIRTRSCPNVYCLRIDYREGPEPPLARFQYLMGDLLEAALGWPYQFEQLWPIDAQGNYMVLTDDRLVVLTQDPQGESHVVLFDGFAQIPQADLSAQTQTVTFVAQGVAVRLWDTPDHRPQSSATPPNADDTSGESDVTVDLPCRFNPSDTSIGSQGGYIGNCVATADYTEIDDGDHLPGIPRSPGDRAGRIDTTYWYVSDALNT